MVSWNSYVCVQCNISNIVFKYAFQYKRNLHVLFKQHLYHFRICFLFALLFFRTSGERFRGVKSRACVTTAVKKLYCRLSLSGPVLYRVPGNKQCCGTLEPDPATCTLPVCTFVLAASQASSTDLTFQFIPKCFCLFCVFLAVGGFI